MLAVRERRYWTMSSVTVRIAGRPSSVKVIMMNAPPTAYRWTAGLPVSPMHCYCGRRVRAVGTIQRYACEAPRPLLHLSAIQHGCQVPSIVHQLDTPSPDKALVHPFLSL